MQHYLVPAIPFSQIHVPTGPFHELLSAARDQFSATARTRGIEFMITSDMQALVQLNKSAVEAGTWEPLLPAANPSGRSLNPENAMWIMGVNGDGEIVTAQAATLYDCTEVSIAERFETLTAFYDDPADAPAGEWCTCRSELAQSLRGRIVWVLAGWTRPDQRGGGLLALAHRAIKLAAWTRWRVSAFVGVSDPEIVPVWSEAKVGPRHIDPEPTIVYNQVGLRPLPMHFMHFSRAAFLGDLADQVIINQERRAA